MQSLLPRYNFLFSTTMFLNLGVFLIFTQATQEPQVTYADLASFNNNEDTVVHMPPPYQPVQYAEIIGTKTSKNN